jgi:hypothetical protein
MHEKDVLLCIQTPYQLDTFRCLGHGFIRIDATHNTTQYEGIMLYTTITCDDWGHSVSASAFVLDLAYWLLGIPVAWMLSSSLRTEAIKIFLNWVQAASPNIRPSIFMSDRDQAQITAIQQAYPLS